MAEFKHIDCCFGGTGRRTGAATFRARKRPGARFGGVRTFTLLGMLSGMAGWLWTQSFEALATVLLAAISCLVVIGYAAASRRDPEATTEVAALVVLAAGTAAGVGYWALAGGVTGDHNAPLVEKSRLHRLRGISMIRACAQACVLALWPSLFCRSSRKVPLARGVESARVTYGLPC